MDISMISVIDTAVKIGLGAFITGFTTFAITRKNHKHERVLKLSDKKISLLETASDNLEANFQMLAFVISRLDGLVRLKYIEPGINTSETYQKFDLFSLDKELISTRDKKVYLWLSFISLEKLN